MTIAAQVATAVAGVSAVAMHGPEWLVDPTNPAYHDLQADVVHRARERAQRYAAALGGALGPLVRLSDPKNHHEVATLSGPSRGRMSKQSNKADFGDVDMSAPELELRATIDATWYLELPD